MRRSNWAGGALTWLLIAGASASSAAKVSSGRQSTLKKPLRSIMGRAIKTKIAAFKARLIIFKTSFTAYTLCLSHPAGLFRRALAPPGALALLRSFNAGLEKFNAKDYESKGASGRPQSVFIAATAHLKQSCRFLPH